MPESKEFDMGKESAIVSGMVPGVQIVTALSDALRDRGGDDSYLLRILDDDKIIVRKIADLLMPNTFPSLVFALDLIPEYQDAEGKTRKWGIVEDVAPTTGTFEFVPFLERDESLIAGVEMRKRALSPKYEANRGLSDAKYLLAHQEEISVALRGKKYLVFAGTLLRSPCGGLRLACLYWSGELWRLEFCWLDRDWRDDCLVRCKQPSDARIVVPSTQDS